MMRNFYFLLALLISGAVLCMYCYSWPMQFADPDTFGYGLIGIHVFGAVMVAIALHLDDKTYGDA